LLNNKTGGSSKLILSAVKDIDHNTAIRFVGRAVRRKFNLGFKISVSETLPRKPNPTTCHESCWLTALKWPAMVKREGLIIGQLHGDGSSLFRSYGSLGVRADAADEY
jgi:hypothetical protein